MRVYTDCIVPEGGHRNSDGYVRVLSKPRKSGGKLTFLHRIEFEKVHGPIPDGYEVNHLCKNRECSNVNHLELLSRSSHAAKDNSQRYKRREDEVVAHYLKEPTTTQYELADMFGLSQSAIHKILKRRVT